MVKMLATAMTGAALAALPVNAWAQSKIPLPQAVVDPAQMKEFVGIVDGARTTIYGEDSHGMQQIHEIVPQFFKTLVEQKGYRVFVFEVQWGVTEGLADFFTSGRTELSTMDSYWLNGAFASRPIAAMLVWIRNWNRAHPNDQIQVAGYQPEQPVTDFAALLPYLDRSIPKRAAELRRGIAACRAADTTQYKTELDFLTANGKILKTGKGAFTQAERDACIAGITAIERDLPKSNAPDARLARLHAYSLKIYFSVLRKAVDDYFSKPDWSIPEQRTQQNFAYHNGDAARWHIYQELQSLRFPKAKVFHWMHNWHGMRQASATDGIGGKGGAGIPAGTVSFGERLLRAEGKAAKNFVTIVPCDVTCKEPANSLEPRFAQAFGGKLTIISTRDKAMRKTLGLDKPGDMFANHHQFGFSKVLLKRQADGVVYVPRSSVVQ